MMNLLVIATVANLLVVDGADKWSILPEFSDIRSQIIFKQEKEDLWPFVANKGTLMCLWVMRQKAVMFAPDNENSEIVGDDVIVISHDPFGMISEYASQKNVIVKILDPTELLERVAPYVEIGGRLCDLDPGTSLPAGGM